MKRVYLIVLLLVMLLVFTSCGASANKNTSEGDSSKENEEVTLEQYIADMSLEDKVAQLFIIRPDTLDTDLTSEEISDSDGEGVKEINDKMITSLEKYHVGGLIMFGKNIASPDQITDFIFNLQKSSKIPMFIGVDEEGGSVARIANTNGFNVKKYDSMESIGKTKDTENAYEVGDTIGIYLNEYGFNLDFAPDSDVNTNPNNIVIGDRSFGSDPDLVSKMVSSEIDGLHNENIMSCIKHFPGHGDVTGDTHKGYVSTEKTWKQLEKEEIVPFADNIQSTDMIMVAHINAPNVTSDGLPSSLSKEMVQGKLRDELGYDGVAITDSTEMGAITQDYSSSESAIKAIEAGEDIVLMPSDFEEAYNGVLNAVKDNTISEKRIDESVMRILKLKNSYNLLDLN